MTTFSDASWDGSPSRWPSTEAYCSDCMLDLNPSGQPKVQKLCKLPYREPGSGVVNKAALNSISGVLQGGMGGVKGAGADKIKSVAKKCLSLMQQAGMVKGPKDKQGLRDLAS